MAKQNPFEELRIENESKFESHREKVKKNVEGQKDFWSFIGELFDLYLPRIISTIFGITDRKNKP